MDELLSEDTIGFKDVPALVPRLPNQGPISLSTVWRWQKNGVKGVKLEACFIAGQYITSKQAVARFIEAIA